MKDWFSSSRLFLLHLLEPLGAASASNCGRHSSLPPRGFPRTSTEFGFCPRTRERTSSVEQAANEGFKVHQEEDERFRFALRADAARRRKSRPEIGSRLGQTKEGGKTVRESGWSAVLEGRKCPNPTTPAPIIWWSRQTWTRTSEVSVRLELFSTALVALKHATYVDLIWPRLQLDILAW